MSFHECPQLSSLLNCDKTPTQPSIRIWIKHAFSRYQFAFASPYQPRLRVDVPEWVRYITVAKIPQARRKYLSVKYSSISLQKVSWHSAPFIASSLIP